MPTAEPRKFLTMQLPDPLLDTVTRELAVIAARAHFDVNQAKTNYEWENRRQYVKTRLIKLEEARTKYKDATRKLRKHILQRVDLTNEEEINRHRKEIMIESDSLTTQRFAMSMIDNVLHGCTFERYD